MDKSRVNTKHPFLQQLKKIIIANLTNQQFSVEKLASACSMSRTSLFRKIKQLTGGSVSKFINQIRLEEAHQMLTSKEYSVSEVAYRVGFSSTTYFTTSFKSYFGYSPSKVNKLEELIFDQSIILRKKLWFKESPNKLLIVTIMIFLITTIIVIYSSLGSTENFKDKTIAVLRFNDMSLDQSVQPFADGLGEEIINSLCKIKDLRVTARNSSFLFNKDDNPRKIKKYLDVNYFIEGSVRKEEDKYRVTVQLVDATEGYHLWSQNYNSQKKDMLNLQEEIARHVSKKLSIELSSKEDLALKNRITNDSLAFKNYSEAIRLHQSNNAEDVREGIVRMKQAIAADSNFALAHARIVSLYSWSSYIGEIQPKEAQLLMQHHVDKALFLDPNMAEGYIARGKLEVLNKNYEAALSSYSRAVELEPNNHRAYGALSYVLRYFKREKEAYDCWFKAYSLDPLRANLTLSIAQYYYYTKKDFEKGVNVLRDFLEVWPDKGFHADYLELFRASIPNGDAANAIIKFYESYKNNPNGARELYWLADASTWLDIRALNDVVVDKMRTLEPDRLTTRWCLTANNARNGKYQENINLIKYWHNKGILNSKEYVHYMSKNLIALNQSHMVKKLISDSIPAIFELNFLDNAENFDPYLVNKLDILENYIIALRELGETEEANHFSKKVVNYLDKEMQRLDKDSILDYKRELHYKLIQASVTDDVEDCIRVLQKAVFDDNHLLNINNRIKISTLLHRIRKDPRFKDFEIRFDKKIAKQRRVVIDYLRNEEVWRSDQNISL